jgi:hypothetical protein
MLIPIIGDLLEGVKGIVGEIVVDPNKKNEINLQLAKLADTAAARLDAQMAAQTDINKVEASNPNIFVAGWRPFIGWTGGVGLAYSAVLEPFMEFVSKIGGYHGTFPVLNTEVLLQVLMAMLGLGVMRTYEKVKGVETTGTSAGPPKPQPAPVTPIAEPPKKKKHFHIF